MAKLTVRVTDEQGNPLAGVAATLTGVGVPQLMVTDHLGQCDFENLDAGRYTLLTSLDGFNVRSTAVVIDADDKIIPVVMRVADEDSEAQKSRVFYRILDVLQVVFLLAVAGLFSWILIKGIYSTNFNLSEDGSARGLITFLVAVVTVGIALILVLAAVMGSGRDLEKRFGFGKEVFTVLIGVLGTIMGFYYGQAVKTASGATGSAAAATQGTFATSSPVTVTPAQPQVNLPFTVSTTVANGTPNYTYSIKFTPDVVVPTDNQPTDNQPAPEGKVNRQFKFKPEFKPDATNGTPLNFVLEVKDAGGQTLTFDNNRDGKQKLVIKAATP